MSISRPTFRTFIARAQCQLCKSLGEQCNQLLVLEFEGLGDTVVIIIVTGKP